MKTKPITFRGALTTAAAAALAVIAGLSGCRGERSDDPPHQFIPDMDDSPKFKNQVQTTFFEDGRAMRPRVVGAVAFGDSMDAADIHRAGFLKEDVFFHEGFDPAIEKNKDGDPAYLDRMPASALDAFIAESNTHGDRHFDAGTDREKAMFAMIQRGQQRFNIYCSACHGYEGDGHGLVGIRWGSPVPSFHDPKYKDKAQKTGKDGYVFHTILNGVPETDPAKPTKMPSYADKVKPLDAWAIVSYVRALQAARTEAPAKAEGPGQMQPDGAPITEVTK
jgi:mono/diheme cytochrome c family protein